MTRGLPPRGSSRRSPTEAQGPDSHDRDGGLYALRVQWLRRYLASFTVTPIGIVLILVLVAALFLFAFGPSGVQAPALIVGVILLIGVVGGVPFGAGGGGGSRSRHLPARTAEFRQIESQTFAATAVDQQAEEELWRKERERRAQDER
jgi:hypothetical protein